MEYVEYNVIEEFNLSWPFTSGYVEYNVKGEFNFMEYVEYNV